MEANLDWQVAITFVVICGICLGLQYLAHWASKKKLKPQPCKHEVTTHSWATQTTRCAECGEVLEDD